MAEAAAAVMPQATVQCQDVLEFAPGPFRTWYTWSYLFLVRHLSGVWKVSYRLLDSPGVFRWFQPLRRWWNLRITKRFVDWLKREPPDVVVATHFLPADVCGAGRAAGWLKSSLVVVVTDWYPHHFWLSGPCDAMVVSTEASASVCVQRGVAREKIHILGIPVGRAFGMPADRAALQARFQLDRSRITALVTSGGTTVGHFEDVIESLMALESVMPNRLQLLVVCGEDEGMRARLMRRAQTSSMPVQVFGFIEYMADVMAVSDLIVTKAGGLTISESLARHVPLILYHIIPGQEQMNAQYVAGHGAALIAPRPQDVVIAVRRCLEEPRCLDELRHAASLVGRANAAHDIMVQVVRPLLNVPVSE